MEANIQAIKKNSREWLRAKGVAAIDRVRESLGDVGENLLDVGAALVDLTAPGVAKAIGRASFDEVCTEDLGIHPSTARRWMALATRLRRRFVLDVGIDRARALMELADATPADDHPEDLFDATLALPSGKKLAVEGASVAELDAAAREFRHAKTAKVGPKGAHGFTTTPAERKAFAAVERRVKRAPKAAHAGVRLVAQRDADGAKVVLEARLGAWSETLAALRGE